MKKIFLFLVAYLSVSNNIYSQTDWEITIIDNSAIVGGHTSLCIDSEGKLHVSYYDYSNGNLKYASNESGSWNYTTLDSIGDVGMYSSIAVDQDNKVHISYFDNTNYDLKYMTNKSGTWVVETLYSTGTVGVYSSIAIDINNNIHICCYQLNMVSYFLHVTNESGEWITSIVDTIGMAAGQSFGSSIAIDSDNKIHASYYNLDPDEDLRYATNKSGVWIKTTLDSDGDVGYYSSLAVDSNDKIHISYWDRTNKDLHYANNTTNLWTATILDSIDDVGRHSSLKIDPDNKVHISYMNFTTSDLLYITNKSGNWIKDTVESTGDVGWFSSLVLDSNINAHICYYDASCGCLKYAKSGNPSAMINDEYDIPLFNLRQNYPNPFNSATTINYSVPNTGLVTIKVYDFLGNEVETLINKDMPKGSYQVEFNGSNLSSGVYYYRMQAASFLVSKKLIISR